MKKIDWSDLEIVNQVARQGTLGAAADALGIHYSTVMRRVDRFQKEQGVHLFERANDGLRVARDARPLIDEIARIADAIDAVTRSLQDSGEPSGTVKLTIPEAMLGRLLMPGVAEFTRQHPQVELKITATNAFLPVGSADADVAIRVLSGPPDEQLVARSAGHYCMSLYATPTYLANHDPSVDPMRSQWIGWEEPGEDLLEWIARSPFPNMPVGPRISDLSLLVEAARQHLGVTRLPCFIGDATPDLVRLPDTEPERARDVWVVTHPSIATLPKIRLVLGFLTDMIRGQAAELQGLPAGAAEPEVAA